MHYALHRREPDSRALVLARRMQPLEGAEELAGVAHVEARAVVAHVESRVVAVAQAADFDAGVLGLAAELPGVADQVLERRAQQARVGVRLHAVPHRYLHLALRLAALQLGHHLAGDLGDIDIAPRELAAGHLREVEQVLDQLPHALGRCANPPEIALRLVRHVLGEVVDQGLAEPVDRAQRRPQVVRHRIAERLQLGVRGLQLGGALRDARLELGVQPQHLFLRPAPLSHFARGLAVRSLELARGALDLGEHGIEALGEEPDLVLGELLGAQREVALFGHLGGELGDGKHRPDQHLMHPAGEDQRHTHRERGDYRRDTEVAEQPVIERVLGAHVDRAEDLPVVHDALEDQQFLAFDARAVAFRQPGKFASLRRIRSEEAPARVIDGGGEDARPVSQQGEVLLGHARVVEAQRRRRHLPDQLGLRSDVIDPALVVEAQVVDDHGGDGEQHGDERRRKLDREDLAADGMARRGHG